MGLDDRRLHGGLVRQWLLSGQAIALGVSEFGASPFFPSSWRAASSVYLRRGLVAVAGAGSLAWRRGRAWAMAALAVAGAVVAGRFAADHLLRLIKTSCWG
jgi:hypothetical protein